jgi:hypothetical protein
LPGSVENVGRADVTGLDPSPEATSRFDLPVVTQRG